MADPVPTIDWYPMREAVNEIERQLRDAIVMGRAWAVSRATSPTGQQVVMVTIEAHK